MPRNPQYLHRRPGSGNWWFRKRIRPDVAHLYSDSFVRESTGTPDRQQAIEWRNRRLVELDLEWNAKALGDDYNLSPEAVRARFLLEPRYVPREKDQQLTAAEVAALNERADMFGLTEEAKIIEALDQRAEELGLRSDDPEKDYAPEDLKDDPKGREYLRLLDIARGAQTWVEAGEDALKASHLKDRTKKLYRAQYPKADAWLPAPGMVSREEARRVLKDMAAKYSGTTVTNFQSALLLVYKYLRDGDDTRQNVRSDTFSLKEISLKKGEKFLPFMEDQLRHLFYGMSGNLRLACRIALYTGMRESEIALAPVRGDLEYFDVLPEYAKTTNSIRRVPIHPHIREDVRLWLQNRWSSSRLSTAFGEWKKAKGGFTPRRHVFHSFRSTLNMHLKRKGVPLEDRVALIGHDTVDNENMTYLELELEDVRKIAMNADWSDIFETEQPKINS